MVADLAQAFVQLLGQFVRAGHPFVEDRQDLDAQFVRQGFDQILVRRLFCSCALPLPFLLPLVVLLFAAKATPPIVAWLSNHSILLITKAVFQAAICRLFASRLCRIVELSPVISRSVGCASQRRESHQRKCVQGGGEADEDRRIRGSRADAFDPQGRLAGSGRVPPLRGGAPPSLIRRAVAHDSVPRDGRTAASRARARAPARWQRLAAEIHACRRCPRLVEWREAQRRRPAAPLPRRGATGRGRWPASATPGAGWRSSASPPPRTAPTAPAACSPATAPATGSTPRCTAPATRTSPSRAARDDGLRLRDAYVTAVVRCAPPANKPTPAERDSCLPYLARELALLERCRTIVALGAFAWDGALRALRELGVRAAPAEAALRPRRRGEDRRLDAARLLPPEPAEHLHRPAHRADARRDLRPRPRAERLTALAARPLPPAPRVWLQPRSRRPSSRRPPGSPRRSADSCRSAQPLLDLRAAARGLRSAARISFAPALLVDQHRHPAQVAVAGVEGAGLERLEGVGRWDLQEQFAAECWRWICRGRSFIQSASSK